MKKFFCLFLFLSLWILPSNGLAEEQRNDKRYETAIDEIVVTASRVKVKIKEIPSNLTVIDNTRINLSAARDLGDLLTEIGLGHYQIYPGSLSTVGIRGFRSEPHGNDLMGHILILIDGRRAGTGNAAKIMTKNIERIEIIRGPAAVQYGSAAMGGLINVITKRGKERPTVFAEGFLGSFGYEEGSIGASGKIAGFDFSGSFTKSSMDEYDTADGEKYNNTGFDDKENSSLNIGYEFMPGNRIGMIYNRFDADRVGSPNYLSQNDTDDYTDKEKESIDVIYEGETPDTLFAWKARYFETEDNDKWSDPTGSNPDFWDDGTPSKKKTEQQGAQAQVSFDSEYMLLTAGFDWVNYEIKSSWNPLKTEYDNPAGFILATARLLDQKLFITGGLRYDDYEVEVKEPKGKTEDDDNFSPQIGMAYLLTDYLKLRANYGEAFVMPAAEQMASDYYVWGYHYKGNPDLDPEKSSTYEAGIDFFYDFLNSSFTYFYTDFEDKIESTTLPGYTRSWDNISDAAISGFEGDFSFDIGTFLNLDFEIKPYANFVYLTEFEDDETDKDLLYTSKLNASYGITVSDLKGLSANLNFAYTGHQKIMDFESGNWPAPVIEKGGFTVASLTVSKKILDFEKFGNVTLKGEIKNLLDREYEYVQGYPMPGRSFFIGLRYDY